MVKLVKGELRCGIGFVVALDDKPLSGIDASGFPPVGELHRAEGKGNRELRHLGEGFRNAPQFFILLHLLFGCDLALAGFCRRPDAQALSASPVVNGYFSMSLRIRSAVTCFMNLSEYRLPVFCALSQSSSLLSGTLAKKPLSLFRR